MSCPLMCPTCSEFSCLVVFPLLILTELFNPKANRFSGRSPRRNRSRRRQSCRRQARSQTDGVARDRARRGAGGNGTAGDVTGARGIARGAYSCTNTSPKISAIRYGEAVSATRSWNGCCCCLGRLLGTVGAYWPSLTIICSRIFEKYAAS